MYIQFIGGVIKFLNIFLPKVPLSEEHKTEETGVFLHNTIYTRIMGVLW